MGGIDKLQIKYEIILAEDGSTDNTKNILNDLLINNINYWKTLVYKPRKNNKNVKTLISRLIFKIEVRFF